MNKIIPIFLTFICAINLTSINGQNIVPNPSFDNFKGKRPNMRPWNKINTVDFFTNADEIKFKDVNTAKDDKNYILRKPRSGIAYVGLRFWPKYNEYLQVSLIEPLKKGKAYAFEMWVTSSAASNCYLKTIGASFYQSKPPYNTSFGKRDYPPQIEIYKHSGITDTTEWTRINGIFIAQGGEKILTIGNFSNNKREKYKRKKLTISKNKKFSFAKREAYYYIDDVSLYELDENGNPILKKIEKNITNSDTATITTAETKQEDLTNVDNDQNDDGFATIDSSLTKIYFTEGNHKLDEKNYKKLATIAEYLLENENTTIEIHSFAAKGELDGDVSKLADKRAKSVLLFFSGNKINKERMIVKNFCHECSNVKINDSKRRECRKVEFNFIENNTKQK